MPSPPTNPYLLKPLTELLFTSTVGKRKFACATGQLKWRADTKALSIKAALLDDGIDSISDSVTLSATAEHSSLSFVFPNGFEATYIHTTLSPRRPATHHYLIEGVAQLASDTKNT